MGRTGRCRHQRRQSSLSGRCVTRGSSTTRRTRTNWRRRGGWESNTGAAIGPSALQDRCALPDRYAHASASRRFHVVCPRTEMADGAGVGAGLVPFVCFVYPWHLRQFPHHLFKASSLSCAADFIRSAAPSFVALWLPRPSPSVAHMNDPYFIAFDFIINLVRIAHDRELIDPGFVGFGSHEGKISKLRDSTFDAGLDRAGRDRENVGQGF